METLDIWTINRKRAVMKIPVTSLCAQAGVARQTFYDAMEGRKEARPDTLARLNAALGRFKMAFAGEIGPMSAHAAYRMALVLSAFHLKSDPKVALASDPARRANFDPVWVQAASTRRLAIWIANQLLGFRQADLARAAGVTKQAVSTALKEIEDLRESEPTLGRVCAELEEVFG